MRGRTLVLLALLVGGLAAFVWFFERELPSSEERRELARRVLPGLERGEVVGLELELGDVLVELRRGERSSEEADGRPPASSEWWLKRPLDAPAEDAAVEELVEALVELEKRRSLEEMDRSAAGLEPPRARIRVDAGDRQPVLEVGAAIPATSDMLVALQGRGEVLVVGGRLFDLLRPSAEAWRNRRLFPVLREDVVGLGLEAREAAVRLEKRGEAFWLVEPIVDRAAEEEVNRLITTLYEMEAARFLEPASGLPSPPSSVATVKVEVRDGPAILVRLYEGDEGSGRRYLELGDRLVESELDLGPFFDMSVGDWRSRRILATPVYRIDRLVVETTDARLDLSREDGEWRREGEPISAAAVNDLLYDLEDVRATGFVAEGDAASVDLVMEIHGREAQESERLTLEWLAAGGALVRVDGRPGALALDEETRRHLIERVGGLREAESSSAPEPADAGEVE